MCGRLVVTSSSKQLASVARARPAEERSPRYNVAPTQDVPAALNEVSRVVRWIRWGLVPVWARGGSIGARLINARAETLGEKPAFARLLERQRCVVLADGFYEWAEQPGRKHRLPWFIYLRDRAPFALAGLWDRGQDPQGGEGIRCTVITTAANALMKPLHDRMPVLLADEALERWLDPAPAASGPLLDLLRPFDPERMAAHPVGPAVNRVDVDEPRCIEPAPKPPETPWLFSE